MALIYKVIQISNTPFRFHSILIFVSENVFLPALGSGEEVGTRQLVSRSSQPSELAV